MKETNEDNNIQEKGTINKRTCENQLYVYYIYLFCESSVPLAPNNLLIGAKSVHTGT